jgi:hypothetical protein
VKTKAKKNVEPAEVDGCIVIPPGYDRPVFQGDMMLTRADVLPADAKEHTDNIVAHSETNHHHVAERAVVFTTNDARTLYLRALGKEPVRIEHKRSFDTHKTIILPPGEVWLVRRQREHIPDGWRIVQD